MKDILKNEKGFTLLEVLIALTVLAVGILTIAIMQTTAIQGNSNASKLSMANSGGRDLIERLLNVDYDDALLDDGAHDETEFTGVNAITLPSNITGIDWTVKEGTSSDNVDDDGDGDIDEGDEVGIKFVNVVVSYVSKGENKTRTINFYKHEML